MGGPITIQSGAPDSANSAIWCNLALALSTDYGKAVSPFLVELARKGYDSLSSKTATEIMEMSYPSTMPAGQGMKSTTTRNFMAQPQEKLQRGADGGIIFQG